MPKLKVYRTPIGFHDAYVAATSQKAALQAWGADADLFARGAAEVVTDPALAEAPLAHPGDVIRLPRGTEAQHLKALGRPAPKVRACKTKPSVRKAASRKPATGAITVHVEPARKIGNGKRPRPRPSRAALDKAEAAIRAAEIRHSEALKALAERKRALELEQRTMREQQASEMQRLEADLRRAGSRFREKLEAWAAADSGAD